MFYTLSFCYLFNALNINLCHFTTLYLFYYHYWIHSSNNTYYLSLGSKLSLFLLHH
nr:MAG TPA: hypothetical protein [Crassvirales sp.]